MAKIRRQKLPRPAVDGNEARWINHSCQPNCEAIEEGDERVFIYSLRDLRPGEELFYDYALEMDEPVTEQLKRECKCFFVGFQSVAGQCSL